MNKFVSLSITLMLAGAPFVQAAAMQDCGMAKHGFFVQPQLTKQPSDCCQPCNLKTDDVLLDKIVDSSRISVLSEGVIVSQATFRTSILSNPDWAIFVQKSPPKPEHLFALYSIYRL